MIKTDVDASPVAANDALTVPFKAANQSALLALEEQRSTLQEGGTRGRQTQPSL
jgi:hypothetical protein